MWLRPLMGVPTTTSACPAARASTASKAASSTMNSELPSRRARSRNDATTAASTDAIWLAPRNDCTRGRG